jgi:hypothetical protein
MKAKQTCAYLYADGHAVLVFEQDVRVGKFSQTIEYVVIHEKFTQAQCSFKGRLILGRYTASGLIKLVKSASRIDAKEPRQDYGSENTRKLGIAVGSLTFDFSDGSSLYFYDMPNLISGPYHYQPENIESFDATATTWASHKVAEIKLATGAKIANLAAA